MNTDIDKVRELAALNAVGALDGEEARAFSRLLAQSAQARREAAAFDRVAEALAKSVPAPAQPSTGLKEKILRAAERSKARAHLEAQLKKLTPPAAGGFGYVRAAAGSGWLPLPIPGAFVKLLSFDAANDYATVLGKLEPGARYPGHPHLHPEDIYMLEGDLHVGDEVIRAGDFHHAEANTRHGVNWSEHGCMLLAVLSKEDLLHQFAAGAE